MLSQVRDDGVAVLTLDDGGATHVAMTPELVRELADVAEAARRDPRVRAMLLRTAKPSFVVGVDLAFVQRLRFASEAEEVSRTIAQHLRRLGRLDAKPLVAWVHGAALGGGFELALACTATIASDDPRTMLGLPEIQYGLIPAANGLLRSAERAGIRVALDLGLSGKSLGAREALELGLIDAVAPVGDGVDRAAELALRLAADPKRRRARGAALLERNPLARRALFQRTRATTFAKTRGHSLAADSLIDLLETFATDGFDAAAKIEPVVFADLVVSEASRRLVELFFAEAAVKKEGGGELSERRASYTARILRRYFDEAILLTQEASRDAIDAAMIDWGFAVGPFAAMSALGRQARTQEPRGRRATADEIALRCALGLIDEALRCHPDADGPLSSARDGDVIAIAGAGFPRFRGGPFRYVDAVGAPEVLRRMRSLERALGPRFEPSALLVDHARSGKRFHD